MNDWLQTLPNSHLINTVPKDGGWKQSVSLASLYSGWRASGTPVRTSEISTPSLLMYAAYMKVTVSPLPQQDAVEIYKANLSSQQGHGCQEKA